jgi:hypothetical protein
MTQSYNLSQLANNLNTAGQLDATDGLVNAVPAANGGTGQSVYTIGDILYASGTTALAKLSDVATGNVLISGGAGAAPSYGKVTLTNHVSGILPVANGGTGLSAPGTSGSVLTSNGTIWTTVSQTGKVLNVQGYTDNGSSTTSTTLVNLNAILWNYTPVSTNSTLYLIASGRIFATALGSGAGLCYFYIGEYTGTYNPVSSAIWLQNQQYSTTYAQQIQVPLAIQVKLNNTSLTTRQFDIMGSSFNASVTINASAISLTVIEVAN